MISPVYQRRRSRLKALRATITTAIKGWILLMAAEALVQQRDSLQLQETATVRNLKTAQARLTLQHKLLGMKR
jgi:hypothetical protein